jgi:predicted GIY-YIG superfamily endonuclease
MPGDRRFVYVLRNVDRNPSFYAGLSSDVVARLAHHNMGRCNSTPARWPLPTHELTRRQHLDT